MRDIKRFLLPLTAGLVLAAAANVQAFSFGDSNFSFGDNNWGPGYGSPYWGPGYAPAPYTVPRLPSYDRSVMRMRRQQMMHNHNEAMDDLGDMLYGRYGHVFERDKAVQLARQIESAAGPVLMSNFHPGAVATSGSRTTPAFWGNESAFKSNADALQAAAGALAAELGKVPGEGEKAIHLSMGSFGENAGKTVPVSPAVWDRFQDVANTCRGCHATFRGPRW